MKKLPLLLIAFILLFFTACESKIEERYLLKNSTINNKNDIESLKLQLNSLEKISPDEGLEQAQQLPFEGTEVILNDAVKKIFDPEGCDCPLPEKIFRRLKRLKEDGKSWAPPSVVKFTQGMPQSARHLSGKSVSSLMHSVTIKAADGKERTWIVLGSPTFKNFDFDRYIVKSGFDSFMYTLDCSGYMNAAIEAAAAVPGADIKTMAKTALDKQSSMFVGGGVLLSPLNSAYYGDAFGVSLSKEERIAILDAMINIPDVSDTDLLIISNSFEVIWASNEGSSSFNGNATFKSGASAGFGFASISGKGDAGGSVTRQSSFSSFNTYFTSRKQIPDLRPFTIKQVKDLKATLVAVQ